MFAGVNVVEQIIRFQIRYEGEMKIRAVETGCVATKFLLVRSSENETEYGR